MTKILKRVILCTAVILGAGSTAFADLVPPWRGDDGSTFQQWDFSSNSTYPDPDAGQNPYGDPILKVNPIGEWVPDPGAWPLSGEIDIYIPNRPEYWPEKEIWIQLTWRPAHLDPNPLLPDQPLIGVTPFDSMQMSRHDSVDLNGWTHSLFQINIWPNPFEEWITIEGDILVDQLTIDTICIPEPATLALLGIGGLMTLIRKRRSA